MNSSQDKIDFIAGRIWSLQAWLQDHGRSSKKPRPEFDIQQRERALQMFEAIQSDYLASQSRRSA